MARASLGLSDDQENIDVHTAETTVSTVEAPRGEHLDIEGSQRLHRGGALAEIIGDDEIGLRGQGENRMVKREQRKGAGNYRRPFIVMRG